MTKIEGNLRREKAVIVHLASYLKHLGPAGSPSLDGTLHIVLDGVRKHMSI